MTSAAEPGPGQYNDLCTYVREQANARVAIVIIHGGDKGMGFSVQAVGGISDAAVVHFLRLTANTIEEVALRKIGSDIAKDVGFDS